MKTHMHSMAVSADPLVSVCIPVFNCERFIGAAIRSLLTQTLEDFEIIVVDNASTDGTVRIVQSFTDSRIQLFQNTSNIGPFPNANLSFVKARGKYIKMLGADDLLYPTCLEKQVRVFEEPGGDSIALACFPRVIIDSSDKVIMRSHGWRVQSPRRIPGRTAVRLMARRGRNLIGEPLSGFFRRHDGAQLGFFSQEANDNFPFCVDWDFWCRLLQLGDLYIESSALGAFRVNSGSNSLNLVGQFAKNDRDFIWRLKEKGLADISTLDYQIGATRAFRDALLRKVLYRFLGLAR